MSDDGKVKASLELHRARKCQVRALGNVKRGGTDEGLV
jgi:hypothetical protein